MLEARQTTVQGGPHVLPTIIVNSVFLAVAWIAVLLRIYTRLMFVKATYCEDWLMVVAVVILWKCMLDERSANCPTRCSFLFTVSLSLKQQL